MNLPYVKHYNKLGNVSNPIPSGYFHNDLNRRQRREYLQKQKTFGKIRQVIICKDGKRKTILHEPYKK